MKNLPPIKELFVKYIAPLGALFIVIGILVSHQGNLTAEIPFDDGTMPWPLKQDTCDIQP